MSWTRFDDNWFVKMEALGLDAAEIGYLVALIQYCSRSNTYDGHLSAFKARAATEVPDPDMTLAHLHDVGRVIWDGKACVILHLDDHLPPPHMREDVRKDFEREKKQRQRAHAKGDHTHCTTATCPEVVPPGHSGDMAAEEKSPQGVPPGPGTGQDGPGRREVPERQEASMSTNLTPLPPPGGVDLSTGELGEDLCADCTEPLGWCTCRVDSMERSA